MRTGVSYYPELIDESEWDRDLTLMRQCGMTIIRMLDFAWTAIEPREGCYSLEWLDRFLALAHSKGIQVILCTPTATPPAWLASQYPEIMLVLRGGERRTFGARRDIDVSSPIYKGFCADLCTVLGKRYGNHPAVIGWQIDNELMGPELAPTECHSVHATWQFRQWLKRKYGTVENLNKAWFMRFWNMEFSDWGEVTTPLHIRVCRGWAVDYQDFYSDSNVDFIINQRDALRAVVSKRQWITHNSTGMFNIGIDHAKYHRALDVAAWDAYPGAASGGHGYPQAFSALACDWMRAATGKPQYILETGVNTPPNSLAHIAELRAHGSDMMIFWHWRGHRGNVEQGLGTFVDHDGQPFADRLAFAKAIASRSEFAGDMPATMPRRQAAMAYSLANFRAEMHPSPYWKGDGVRFLETVGRAYQPAWQLGLGLDVIKVDEDPSGYKLLVLPNTRLMDEADAVRIRDFVKAGGVLVATAKVAHQTATGVYYRRYGGALEEALGVYIRSDVKTKDPSTIRTRDGQTFAADAWIDRVEEANGDVLATFADGPAAGQPAIVTRDFGKGKVFYLAASSAPAMRYLLPKAAAAAGLSTVDNPFEDVSILPDLWGKGTWYMNHASEPRTVGGVAIPARDFVLRT